MVKPITDQKMVWYPVGKLNFKIQRYIKHQFHRIILAHIIEFHQYVLQNFPKINPQSIVVTLIKFGLKITFPKKHNAVKGVDQSN